MSATSRNRLLEPGELEACLAALPSWSCAQGRLLRSYRFDDFRQAFAFMTRCALEAERLDHHPDWSNAYGRVEVELRSHQLGGVSVACAALARVMEACAAQLGGAD